MEHIDQLNCVICFEIFQNPVTISCGHTFCYNCILGVFQSTNKCPFCQNLILSSNFQTNFVLQKIIDNIKQENAKEDIDSQINQEKKQENKNKEESQLIKKIIAFNLIEHKFTFDGTLYKLKLQYNNSNQLFYEILKEKYFAALSRQNKNLASVFKIAGINTFQSNSVIVIARCLKRVDIDCVENVSLMNSPFYIENELLKPDEQFSVQVLSYKDIEQLPNDLNDQQKQQLEFIDEKVNMLFAKLKKNNLHDYNILKIRHQVDYNDQTKLSIKYQNNVQKYVEFLSQLLNMSKQEKQRLFFSKNIDEKLKILYEFLEPITIQNDPVFVFYITQNLFDHSSMKVFLLLLSMILFLVFRFWVMN